jgi:hypothetical protein
MKLDENTPANDQLRLFGNVTVSVRTSLLIAASLVAAFLLFQ